LHPTRVDPYASLPAWHDVPHMRRDHHAITASPGCRGRNREQRSARARHGR